MASFLAFRRIGPLRGITLFGPIRPGISSRRRCRRRPSFHPASYPQLTPSSSGLFPPVDAAAAAASAGAALMMAGKVLVATVIVDTERVFQTIFMKTDGTFSSGAFSRRSFQRRNLIISSLLTYVTLLLGRTVRGFCPFRQ